MTLGNSMMSQREIYSVRSFNKPASKHAKKNVTCISCDEHATKEITFLIQEQDVMVTERYCNNCADAIVAENKQS
ncbi:MAG: hypothetical protein HMLIMOIP_001289 [Candidatus Nitrosomirales archaeon]|jgi:hypothetical protein